MGLILALARARQRIRELEDALVQESIPEPAKLIGLNVASSILLDKMEEMGCPGAEIYLPDTLMRVYTKESVIKFLELEETDKIVYQAENKDCDDFAAILYGEFLGLVWTNLHALNFFISNENELYFVEPQTDQISQTLAGWQGDSFRFFLGR